jgi:hypothetical protein
MAIFPVIIIYIVSIYHVSKGMEKLTSSTVILNYGLSSLHLSKVDPWCHALAATLEIRIL